jgi:CBS domain-containing protein
LSAILTAAVYASEDAFQRLPIHWKWWPAIGGLFIGVGGYVFPQALGVGYETIADVLRGDVASHLLVGILIVKSIMWAASLGSGTSGGVLAPLLMIGGALGGIESWWLPAEGVGFWPLVSIGAILCGAMRVPLTGIVFSLELTHDVNMLLPLLIAVSVAHGFTVLVMRRSILTEKIARRGYHLSREYAIDPLEILFVREVMRTNVAALPADAAAETIASSLRLDPSRGQRLYPVVAADDRLVGVVTRADLQRVVEHRAAEGAASSLASVVRGKPVVASPDEPLRVIVHRMAETGITRFPVVERHSQKLIGMVSLTDLLKARTLNLDAEQRCERVLGAKITSAFGRARKTA